MDEFHGQAESTVDVTPDALFAFITDIDRLPEWNDAIESVVDKPESLAEGQQWTVKMHPRRTPSWRSVSRVEDLDRPAGRFAYETRHADGNPSYVTWSWQIAPAGGGSHITVTWDCYLKTFDRRVFGGPLRKRQLAREVPRSLATIAELARHTPRGEVA